MDKKINIPKSFKITVPQLLAIINARDMLSAMVGGGEDFDVEAKKTVRSIDRFLKKHGLKSKYS